MSSPVVILIISHRPELTYFEEISLKQCVKVLGHYPIKIILPEGCDPDKYLKICKGAIIEYVNPEWLSSMRNYNQFRLRPHLYLKNIKYKYALFYELDSFVFRDELMKWCNSGYDYLGAPWFEGYHYSRPDANFIVGCNGGFTLRNIRKGLIGNWLNFYLKRTTRDLNLQEDKYWINYIAPYFPRYKIAPSEVALQFAFENHPRRLFAMNNEILPFGVHAWQKYDLEFWKPFIEAEGYQI